ncbi:unnamed protein product [Phytophthora fragariaefolia]|uniref:Unnamed protein product n=1 Tax=Phytophthora fragariaefolia TaxID=1490495 RepID=A0A9W6YAU9_9STRA|nr:unnamed protein product [Phytophthora fragariaefolia]
MMESTDTVAGGGGAHHRVLDTDARMQPRQAPLERTALPAIAALMDSTARRLLRNGTAPPPPMASAQVNARAVERTVTTAVEDGRAAGHAITADGVAVTATPSPPTRHKRGRSRGSKNKSEPTTDANQPKRRRTAATPQRSIDNVMSQVSTPRVPERVVGGSNAARRSQQAEPLAVSHRSGIHVTTTLAASVGVTQAVVSTDPEPEVSPLQLAPTTRSKRPPLIPDLYINTLVAFSPAMEGWMTRKTHKYVGVGNAYLVGGVCRTMTRTLFQIQWLDSKYQNHVESLNLNMRRRGNANYRSLHGSAAAVLWRSLCEINEGETIDIEDDVAALEACMEEFNSPTDLPTSLAEAINSMRFDRTANCEEPADLFQHADGSSTTWLRPKFTHLFEHSASASFFAYIPVSFWQQVVGETNIYARVHGIKLKTCFSLEGIMKFIGVLLYMSLVNKGEYSNYWGQQVEDAIFGGNTVDLDSVMPLRRFKKLRQAFSFRCVEDNATNTDLPARIRPLLNLLKSTGSKYVEVGRNVALDEARIACRSKYGKPLIVYNPMKPGGKYHFRIYMLHVAHTCKPK